MLIYPLNPDRYEPLKADSDRRVREKPSSLHDEGERSSGRVLGDLYDLEEGVEGGSDALHKLLGQLLDRMIRKKLGYYT